MTMSKKSTSEKLENQKPTQKILFPGDVVNNDMIPFFSGGLARLDKTGRIYKR